MAVRRRPASASPSTSSPRRFTFTAKPSASSARSAPRSPGSARSTRSPPTRLAQPAPRERHHEPGQPPARAPRPRGGGRGRRARGRQGAGRRASIRSASAATRSDSGRRTRSKKPSRRPARPGRRRAHEAARFPPLGRARRRVRRAQPLADQRGGGLDEAESQIFHGFSPVYARPPSVRALPLTPTGAAGSSNWMGSPHQRSATPRAAWRRSSSRRTTRSSESRSTASSRAGTPPRSACSATPPRR